MIGKNNVRKIQNKKARYLYHILETYTAGVQLLGLDIKLIRKGKVSITETFCGFIDNELFINNMHLAERENDRIVVCKNKTQRKLLLRRNELNKLNKRISDKGLSIVPLSMYFNENGFVKIEIALVKGKREYDKRQTIKKADSDRELARAKRKMIKV